MSSLQQACLETIIKEYIRATGLKYSEIYTVCNVILNHFYDKEKEQ